MRLVRLTAIGILFVLGASESLLRAQPDKLTVREQELVVTAKELGRSKKLSNTQKLLPLLKDSSEVVRAAAAQNLGELLADYGDPYNAVTTGGENFGEIAEAAAQLAKRVTLTPFEVAGFQSGLIAAVNDSTASVRVAAIEALGRIFVSDNPKIPRRAVKKAIAPHVMDPDVRVVFAAIEAAHRLHIRESRGDLLASLDHENADVRASAAQCLALMGFSEAAMPISKLLKDREPNVRRSAARELFFLFATGPCDRAIGTALLDALPEKSLRSDVARTIAILTIPSAQQPVVSAFQTDIEQGALWLADFSDYDIKRFAAFIGPGATNDMLGGYLSKGPASVRAQSALFLGELHNPQAAPLLFEALHDTDNAVVSAAIRAMPEVTSEIGDKRTLERLHVIATLPDSSLVEILERQLPKFRDREIFGIALTVLRNRAVSTDGTCSVMPLMCSGRWVYSVHPNLFDRPDLLSAEVEMLSSKDADVRLQTARALAFVGMRQAVQPVSRLLKDPEPKVRATAGEALFWMCVDELCDDRLIPCLLEALADKAARGSAARTLAYWNKPEAVQPVLSALQEDVAQDGKALQGYWEADFQSLADFLKKDNLKALLELYLKNGPPGTRQEAERFLRELGNR